MRGGGKEGRSLPVQFPLPLHLAAKGQVGRLQRFEGGGQAPGHFIQTAAQRADLVPAPLPARPAEVQPGHLLRDAAQPDNGPGDGSGVDQRARQGKRQQGQQQPRRHLDQGPHGQIFRLHPGRDVERVGLGPVGKAHLGGERGLLRGGDAHRILLRRALGVVGHRGLFSEQVDGRALIPLRPHGEPRTGARDLPVRPHQNGLGAGGAEELVQHRAAFMESGAGQVFHQGVHLPGEVVADHGGVSAGSGPCDEAEGDGPRQQQDQGGHQEDPGGEAFSDPPSQHDSPPP